MSTPQPLVSIITPFLNEATFIKETILSVLVQTWNNWELILVDDGSTDNSSKIARNFAAEHPAKIRYYHHHGHVNLGSSTSRNLGIQMAKGDLIAFLDADDVFLPDYLENQVNTIIRTGATMVCEATKYWYSWDNNSHDGNKKRTDVVIPVGVPADRLYGPGTLNRLLYPLNIKAAAPCMCGIIAYRDAILEYGKFEDSFRKYYEDQVFLSKMYCHESVYISSSCRNLYRQRTDSMMADIRDPVFYNKMRREFLEWFESYIREYAPSDRELHNMIQHNLLPYRYPVYHAVVHVFPRRFYSLIRRIVQKNSSGK